jgi:hypothetical protein
LTLELLTFKIMLIFMNHQHQHRHQVLRLLILHLVLIEMVVEMVVEIEVATLEVVDTDHQVVAVMVHIVGKYGKR